MMQRMAGDRTADSGFGLVTVRSQNPPLGGARCSDCWSWCGSIRAAPQELSDLNWHEHEKKMMYRALELAAEAEAAGEVAVGAVIERAGAVVGEGNNRVIRDSDPSGHAEMVALREACAAAGNYRLPGATLYVTLEPCAMCAGALVHARIQRVVFAAWDPRVGAGGSIINLLDHPHMNHRCIVSSGLMGEEAGEMLRGFFAGRRGQGTSD